MSANISSRSSKHPKRSREKRAWLKMQMLNRPPREGDVIHVVEEKTFGGKTIGGKTIETFDEIRMVDERKGRIVLKITLRERQFGFGNFLSPGSVTVEGSPLHKEEFISPVKTVSSRPPPREEDTVINVSRKNLGAYDDAELIVVEFDSKETCKIARHLIIDDPQLQKIPREIVGATSILLPTVFWQFVKSALDKKGVSYSTQPVFDTGVLTSNELNQVRVMMRG